MAATSATGGIVKLRLFVTQVSRKLEVAIICPDNLTKIHEFYQASFEPRKTSLPPLWELLPQGLHLNLKFLKPLHPGKWRAKRTWNHHLSDSENHLKCPPSFWVQRPLIFRGKAGEVYGKFIAPKQNTSLHKKNDQILMISGYRTL